MEKGKYIPVKDIEDVLFAHFSDHGRFLSMPEAAMRLINDPAYELATEPSSFPGKASGMSDEDFCRCFDRAAIPAEDFTTYPPPTDWREIQYRQLRFNQYVRIYKHISCNLSNHQHHSHTHFEITYVFKGKAQISFEKKALVLEPGDVCIIAPETSHGVTVIDPEALVINMVISRHAFESLLMQFSQEGDLVSRYLQNMLYHNGDSGSLLIHSSNSDELKSCVKAAACASFSKQYYSYSAAVSWLALFLGGIFQEYYTLAHRNRDKQINVHEDYILLIQFIQDNYQTLTLTSLAEKFNYNKAYLSRLIVRIMGKSLSEIITELRLEKACDYLAETDFRIQQISDLCGFDNQNYFGKVFKSRYGITPSEYRKNLAGSIGK